MYLRLLVKGTCENPDNVAEWLRREIANLLHIVRVGSNPIIVETIFCFVSIFGVLLFVSCDIDAFLYNNQ
jgi:hypothetical protein